MKLRISQEELQSRSLYVATPMYAGQCFGLYSNSLMHLAVTCAQQGVKMRFAPVFNESLVTRGRNTLANDFLRGDLTHLIFIDSDIEYTVDDIFTLLVLADPKTDKQVICGTYPKKHINWKRAVRAANQGLDPEQCSTDMVLNTEGRTGTYPLNELLDMKEAGTGFMIIQRQVFEQFIKAYPETEYLISGGTEFMFFNPMIDPTDRRFLSEDFAFCKLIRDIGVKIWIAPWINLNHMGYYKFIGNSSASSLVTPATVAASHT